MNKNEYLQLRLQKDFFNLTILRQGGKSAAEISDELENIISSFGSYNYRNLQSISTGKIHELIDEEFSLDKIKNGHTYAQVLPEGVGPEQITTVVEKFKSFLESEQKSESKEQICRSLLHKIENDAWNSNLSNLADGISMFLGKIAGYATQYGNIIDFDEDSLKHDLEVAYEKARKVTIREKLTSTNDEDIIALRYYLMEGARHECCKVLYQNVAGFLQSIVNDIRLSSLVGYLMSVKEKAAGMNSKLADSVHNEEYDADYESVIPVGFFSRNIEQVDEYKAFNMSIMYAIARYESVMKFKGYLVDGELAVFTCFPQKDPSVLLTDVISILSDFVLCK